MALSGSTLLFFLSCGFWVAEARQYNSIITVPNGGRWGRWGPPEFCSKGYAFGFQIKVEPYGTVEDSTGLNAISLLCDDGKTITSSEGPWGSWQLVRYCPHGKLTGFSLKVLEERSWDNTAANNIAFICSDNKILIGNGNQEGRYSPFIYSCRTGSKICGIQTKVQPPQYTADDTSLNDVNMFCCE